MIIEWAGRPTLGTRPMGSSSCASHHGCTPRWRHTGRNDRSQNRGYTRGGSGAFWPPGGGPARPGFPLEGKRKRGRSAQQATPSAHSKSWNPHFRFHAGNERCQRTGERRWRTRPEQRL